MCKSSVASLLVAILRRVRHLNNIAAILLSKQAA